LLCILFDHIKVNDYEWNDIADNYDGIADDIKQLMDLGFEHAQKGVPLQTRPPPPYFGYDYALYDIYASGHVRAERDALKLQLRHLIVREVGQRLMDQYHLPSDLLRLVQRYDPATVNFFLTDCP